MTRADTIARHLSVFETHLRTVARGVDVETRTSAVPDAVAALREAFAALDGGALPGVAWEAARAGEEAERLRAELAAVKAERDALNAAEADLRHALRQIAELVGGAVSLGASTDMHCAVANEVRVVVADLRAERDALAAEVRRSREQKPVRWAVVLATGHVASVCHEPDIAAEVAATVAGRRVAPLYLAPVVRDHSGVIAQCEEALREWDRDDVRCRAGALMAVATTAALAALRGAS